ncbi:helix-turn-helix domain-containing protein [Novosphingobium sp. TCA1]|uniref:AraC family transcriptional regulator n=1 Tax=Novosphingobium sp. TCA1 TaxID=2682474 RepID=UPI0013083B24|nr:helix-turn-helix transcriptional regulator [Novosphingobium sp. TCA1]GFE74729.1 AraC family transcriptional regulator [Novosphingobium sp. TCA1]
MTHTAIAEPNMPPVEVRSRDLPQHGMIVPFHGRQANGYYDPPHVHDRAQFSYRIEGYSVVQADGRRIFLPPGRGVWIPAGVEHEVTCRGPAAYNAFYVDTGVRPQPETVRVISISPLLHALVETLLEETDSPDVPRRRRLSDLVLEEILRARDVGAIAPLMPRSARLRIICDRLYRDPASPVDLDGWAALASMSRRTFTRAFREETGLSPAAWHQQLRIHHVDGWLEQGMPLQKVAYRLGYASAASLTRSYARIFGTPPPRPNAA